MSRTNPEERAAVLAALGQKPDPRQLSSEQRLMGVLVGTFPVAALRDDELAMLTSMRPAGEDPGEKAPSGNRA